MVDLLTPVQTARLTTWAVQRGAGPDLAFVAGSV